MISEAMWALGRGTGVVALICFTVSIALGVLGRSGRDTLRLGRFGINEVHRTAALTGTALIGVHVGALMLDPYAQLSATDAVVPFLGTFRPLWQGLGTLAVDLLAIITVVSLLRDRVGPRIFRAVHWLTWAMWPVALLHAVGNGTDRGTIWMIALDAACVATVLAAAAWRLAPSFAGRGHDRLARRGPSHVLVP